MEPKEDYLKVIENIRKMRLTNPAPVDTMGCGRSADSSAAPKVQRFQTLISLLLSSQTKDEVTFAAMGRLKEHGLTPGKMKEIPESELKEMLKPVGFFNTKAKHVKAVSEILLDKYDADIPKTVEDLMTLPGIGPKMAYICMQAAWGINAGIGVDTHVHRISERLGWTTTGPGKRKKTPEDTRKELESWIPREYWREVNFLLVGFGQTVCAPLKPRCGECLNNEICPYGKKALGSGGGPKQRVKMEEKEEEEAEDADDEGAAEKSVKTKSRSKATAKNQEKGKGTAATKKAKDDGEPENVEVEEEDDEEAEDADDEGATEKSSKTKSRSKAATKKQEDTGKNKSTAATRKAKDDGEPKIGGKRRRN